MSGLADVVRGSDRRAALIALRDHLAGELEGAKTPYVAGLAKQLAEVLDKIEAIPAGSEGTVVDELNAKRAGRGAAASQPAGGKPAGGGRGRRASSGRRAGS